MTIIEAMQKLVAAGVSQIDALYWFYRSDHQLFYEPVAGSGGIEVFGGWRNYYSEGCDRKYMEILFPHLFENAVSWASCGDTSLSITAIPRSPSIPNRSTVKFISPSVCECGAEKIGVLSHSHWCPKGVNNETTK